MARTNNLTDFLTDISTAIKQKIGDNTPIPAANFDTEIASIQTGGTYQEKIFNINQNGNYVLNPDTGYDAMSKVNIGVNVASGSGEVKLFETIEEMQADPTPNEGDLAIVYYNTTAPYNPGDHLNDVTFPKTVTFDTAITTSASLTIRTTSGKPRIQAQCLLSATAFVVQDMYGSIPRITYSSSDGLTYTRTDSYNDTYNFGGVKVSATANVNILKFFTHGSVGFDGLFMYSAVNNEYQVANTQLDTVPDSVYNGIFMGKNGVENGTLQVTTNLSKTQLKNKIELYDNISALGTEETNLSNIFKNSNIVTLPRLNLMNVTNVSDMFGYPDSLSASSLSNFANDVPVASQINNSLIYNTGIPLNRFSSSDKAILFEKGFVDCDQNTSGWSTQYYLEGHGNEYINRGEDFDRYGKTLYQITTGIGGTISDYPNVYVNSVGNDPRNTIYT